MARGNSKRNFSLSWQMLNDTIWNNYECQCVFISLCIAKLRKIDDAIKGIAKVCLPWGQYTNLITYSQDKCPNESFYDDTEKSRPGIYNIEICCISLCYIYIYICYIYIQNRATLGSEGKTLEMKKSYLSWILSKWQTVQELKSRRRFLTKMRFCKWLSIRVVEAF